MQKKIFPVLALIAAIAFYFWVKSNQRGELPQTKRIDIETARLPFERDTSLLVYSRHARCRMGCRQIDAEEVKDILMHGKLDASRIQESEKGVTYPLEGITADKQYVRVVFAPEEKEIVVVTVIDLEKEWPCNCN
ncbi:MAG TPA: hypothetical protein DEU93_05500 [Chitinophagaceae bacterium]|nr:hypothetical protein [Chitinophagaceae bacterium]HML57785.1 DUF4258 domain-containing protein [Ferruginibacter sp.]